MYLLYCIMFCLLFVIICIIIIFCNENLQSINIIIITTINASKDKLTGTCKKRKHRGKANAIIFSYLLISMQILYRGTPSKSRCSFLMFISFS